MPNGTYFLVNDTRYDNHHGGLTVVRNLHAAMSSRGWSCVGSLPVSSVPGTLRHRHRELAGADLILINGEGSLHHDGRNALRLLEITRALVQTHQVVLLNALWQENDPALWAPLLTRLGAIYARDLRSQSELQAMGVEAGYAPDLTFYDYPQYHVEQRGRFLCTDSVLRDWSYKALRLCQRDPELEFQTLLTGQLRFMRGARDWPRAVKLRIFRRLGRLGFPVPASQRVLRHAEPDTAQFLKHLSASRAVCAARYHALCFALQQEVPFVAVASNSHKSQALLEEVGLSQERYLLAPEEHDRIKQRLQQAAVHYPEDQPRVRDFKRLARQRIDTMFDRIASIARADSRQGPGPAR